MKRGLVKRAKSSVRLQLEPLESRQLLSASLTVSNSLMVFNAVQNSSVSPTETLTLTNTGDAPLTLGNTAFAMLPDPAVGANEVPRFSVLNLSSAPATLSPGQSFGLQINYNAKAVETDSALLDISTNDPVHPTQVVTVRGIGTKGLGGSNQPSLATILRAYNIPTIVGEGPNDSNAASDSIYPNPPDASSQEVPLQRLVKAGSGPVTISVLASFTASGFSKSYVLGTYTPGNPIALNQLFYTTSTQNQTTYVQPQGSTTFDPGTGEFGFYFISNVQVAGRVGYSEDSLNTWDTTNNRKFRFFPMENPDGSVVPNTFIMTTTEWNAPIGYDFTNIVAIVHNVKAAPDAPTAPVISLTNSNAVTASTNMVFSRIASPNSTLGDVVHDTGTLVISDSGNQPLVVSGYALSPQWTLVSPPTFPFTVAPGASQSLTIKFIANSEPSVPFNETNSPAYPSGGGMYHGGIVIYSNDPTTPADAVQLAGWYQYHSENSNEPSLQTIVNQLYGWGVNVNPTPISELTESSATGAVPTYYGEEVVSAYWQEADPGQSVTVQQIAAYHTEGNTTVTNWYTKGSSTINKLYQTATDDGQTLLPYKTGTTTPATGTFSTTSIFGFKVDAEYSDDSKNALKTGGGHHFRFYPLRDATGALIPNTYIMAMDYSNSPQNFDFQDNVYIVSNIRPASTVSGIAAPQTTAAPPAPADFYAAGLTSGGVSLEWAAISDSTLKGYNVYRSSSQNGSYGLLTSTPITATSYTDLSAPGGTVEFYKVTAFDSSTNTESLAALSHTTTLITSTIVPPAPGAFTATGIPGAVSLSWSAVSDPTLQGYNVYSSTSASGPFTLLTSSPISTTSYTDSSAVVGSPTYYEVTAVDASSGLSSTPSTANGTALAISGLQSVDIGSTPSGSTTVVTPGTDYNVTAGGPGIANNADGFRFIYQTQTGDFDVKVQVLSLTVAGNYSTAGIMARSTLTTTSPDVYMSASPINYRFKWRTSVATVNNVATGGAVTFPNAWVRLVRVGNQFTGYSSTNGVTWTLVSTINLALPTTLDLGLAVASNINTATTTTQLRGYGNTVITTQTPPPAPASLTATGIQGGVSLSWAAVADATLKGYNVYSSSSATGTFTLLTPTPITATTYTDTGAIAGVTTYYQVTAVDSASGLESSAATANSAPVVAAAPLTSVDIGASPSGSTSYSGSAYTVVAGGPGVTGAADGFRYLYTSQTGDFDVKVQVASLTVAGNYSTAGIMARATTDAASANVYMSASPVNFRFKDRPTSGAATAITTSGATTYPNVWVRLQRIGNVFNGYTSTNGVNWTLMSTATVALPTTIDLGLAVASNVTTTTTTAVLKNYSNT
jgi:fibronectin type 3 domain-containing protein/regulation of enolase protein 1 (concanavalin A-like superfamily)